MLKSVVSTSSKLHICLHNAVFCRRLLSGGSAQSPGDLVCCCFIIPKPTFLFQLFKEPWFISVKSHKEEKSLTAQYEWRIEWGGGRLGSGGGVAFPPPSGNWVRLVCGRIPAFESQKSSSSFLLCRFHQEFTLSFAQWQCRSRWGLFKARLLLIEEFTLSVCFTFFLKMSTLLFSLISMHYTLLTVQREIRRPGGQEVLVLRSALWVIRLVTQG